MSSTIALIIVLRRVSHQTLAISARLAGQGAWEPISMSLPSNAKVTGKHSHSWLFDYMWVLGIQTQVLVYIQHTLLLTGPSSQLLN